MPSNRSPATAPWPALANTIWRQIDALTVELSDDAFQPARRIAVIAGCGDTETGFHHGSPRFRPLSRKRDALRLLGVERGAVMQQFISEVQKIHVGISEGRLIDDGSEQFAVALIVADDGPDAPLVPLTGVAVQCNAAHGENLVLDRFEIEETWDDFADPDADLVDLPSSIPEPTVQAYRKTIYEVWLTPRFALAVDHRSDHLARLYVEHDVETAAYVTACNPVGRPQRLETNEARQRQLAADLDAGGFRYFEGVGRDSDGKWIGEPSFLILGISSEEAEALGERYRQNAILFAASDAVPRLILLR